MHFEKDILKGKIHSKRKLREEAVEELEENKKGKKALRELEKEGYVSKKLEKEGKSGLARHRALEAKKGK